MPRPRKPKEDYGLPVTIGAITLKTHTDFVILVENQLGFMPNVNEKTPLWKARGLEVAKLKRKIAERPGLYTWPNLVLAVEYCSRHKIRVASPAAVCWKVDKALKEIGPEAPISDVGERVQKAIAWEQERNLPGRDEWVVRLSRAVGDIRNAVLDEWRQARFR